MLRISAPQRIHSILFVCLLLASSLLITLPPRAQAAGGNKTIYVNHNATGLNDGSDWENAFTMLQSAITSAQGNDEIWVAKGIYYTTNTTGSTGSSFLIQIPMKLYGGFAGNETELHQRNWEQNKTILSGDIERNDTYSGTYGIVTQASHIVGTNARKVVRITNTGPNVVIDGFVITGGKITDITDDINNYGAGMSIINSNPTIKNILFSGNTARNGGALFHYGSSPIISDSTFVGNSARASGGAMYSDSGSHFNISNSTFILNSALNGGAMSTYSSNPVISNSSFYTNTASMGGGAISNAGANPHISDNTFIGNSASEAGGAISNVSGSKATITNNHFSRNSAPTGGAVRNHSSPATSITNNSFSTNTATSGGAIANNSTGSATISNNAFSAQNATNGGAIYNEDSSPLITNNTFSANTATNGGAINNNGSNGSINHNVFSGQNATNGGALYIVDSASPQVMNNAFVANTATLAAAIYSQNSTVALANSSFAANRAANAGGAIYISSNTMRITNSSFSGNHVTSSTNAAAIHGINSSKIDVVNSVVWGNEASVHVSATSTITFTHSLVEQCNVAGTWSSTCGTNGGNNVVDTDPLFVNAVSSTSAPTTSVDLRLQANSPLINTGNNALNSTATDLDGNPRIIDSQIDLGAYEALPTLKTVVVGSGSITYTPALAQFPIGTTLTLTATADSGWSFAGWSGHLSGSSSPTTLLINGTKSITATFSNDAPIADAGADQAVVAGSTVTLDGSASFDADPTQTLTYGWAQSAGTPVTLSNTSAISPTFSAPSVADTLTFTLVVTDSMGLASTADSVTITVTNDAPIANAGADQSVLAGATVTLNGSASSDPDGHTPLAYAWTQSAGTPVTLSNTSAISPTFSAPSVADTLTFTLVVTDSMGLVSTADSVTITVTNGEPVADAGVAQTVMTNSTVTLDGSASSDPDGHTPLAYGWAQTAGTPVMLSNTSAISPTFSAPSVADTLTFTLVVTDSMGLVSTADSVTITVTNDAPIANAGPDQAALAGATVTLNGSSSSDPDGHTPLAYAWAQTAGTPVALADANTAQPTFSAPSVADTLTFSLLVTDSMGLVSAADSVTITVTNDAPIADAGTDQAVLAGATVTLDGSASSDPDGHTPLAYAWAQTAGTPVTLAGANTAQPTFSAPSVADTLTFTLVVTDSMGLVSTADSVTITVVQYRLHLPMLVRPAAKSNLVVTALKADQNGISLTIRNTGDAPTSAAFWVDLYINPSQPPTMNTPWQKIAPAGAAWGINRTLAPGESLTLTPSSQFYAAQHSSGSYQAGAVLYAIVDSYHESSNHGAEHESDESDNRYGPVSATAAGTTTAPISAPRATPAGLPAR